MCWWYTAYDQHYFGVEHLFGTSNRRHPTHRPCQAQRQTRYRGTRALSFLAPNRAVIQGRSISQLYQLGQGSSYFGTAVKDLRHTVSYKRLNTSLA